MPENVGRLLLPALRWDRDRGFDHLDDAIDELLGLGVGGFILFGGVAEAVARLTASLRDRAGRPLLVGADLERGAGQQFGGATTLPPPLALGVGGDGEVARRAGRITAEEALALGVNWLYAPVADLDAEPANPIVGTRAFGREPAHVAPLVRAWIEGARSAGALACAKHFPGHGRTTGDSHLELPEVGAGRDALEADLEPFRAAVQAGVDSVMTAHVAYPGLDPSGTPATLSRAIVTGLLRRELGFDGVVITDALIMEGVRGGGEGEAAVQALAAGCDVLAYPQEPAATLAAVRAAVGMRLPAEHVRAAVDRIESAALRGHRAVARASSDGAAGLARPAAENGDWARDVALSSIQVLRGEPSCGPAVDLLVIDDDVGGPFPHSIPRHGFGAALRSAGVDVREVGFVPARPTGYAGPPVVERDPSRPLLVALFADIKGFKGRPGLSATAEQRLRPVSGDAVVVLFGHPRMAAELTAPAVLCAWGGEPVMQEAAARWLAG